MSRIGSILASRKPGKERQLTLLDLSGNANLDDF